MQPSQLRTTIVSMHTRLPWNWDFCMGIEVIPGVELSSEIEGTDLHILGYLIDITNLQLHRRLKEMKEARFVRARQIVDRSRLPGRPVR